MIMLTGTRISEGNRKMGTVPSVSLLPVVTCPADAPCKSDCYVVRNMLRGPHSKAIRAAYTANTELQKSDRNAYFNGIQMYLSGRRSVPFFRFHVSGDIPDGDYLDMMLALAERYPATRFLAFTKRFDLLQTLIDSGVYVPENITLRASEWYGRTASEEIQSHFWSAWYTEEWTHGAEETAWSRERADYDSVAAFAFECPGSCATCKTCWDTETDVRFHRH